MADDGDPARGAADDDFIRSRHLVMRGILHERLRSFLHEYALKSVAAGKLGGGDPALVDTPCLYSDPLMEALLEMLLPRVEAASGLRLHPTYSYLRAYKHGDTLGRHRDRPSCEVSVSVTLGCEAPRPWPLWLDVGGVAQSVTLEPGDALLYKGIEVAHWRDRFPGQHVVQVFLHYVDQQGPYRDWIFDRRPSLGASPVARQILSRLR